jgi:hypothetical protein
MTRSTVVMAESARTSTLRSIEKCCDLVARKCF